MSSDFYGYYQSPTIHGSHIVFACEGDLWSITDQGGLARRLTDYNGYSPCLSPDGTQLAFCSGLEQSNDVYVMPFGGSPWAPVLVWCNRQHVHTLSDGRLGYLHVPNMKDWGYAEFHRYYRQELTRTGLVVDVRYNGGGNVSQLLLEKLNRKRIGYSVSRHGAPVPYPRDAVLGPIVCVTNEYASSDGDIFSHNFKLMGLGPLVGKRTWGGTIGVSPSHRLVDGTLTRQPEHANWFTDIGFGLENAGTLPDEPVDISPDDWAAGKDPQLDRAISIALEQLERQPPRLPDFEL